MYLRIQNLGVTNMMDIPKVIELSGGELNKEDILYIMENYDDLVRGYNTIWKD
jgi:hypothetical protein